MEFGDELLAPSPRCQAGSSAEHFRAKLWCRQPGRGGEWGRFGTKTGSKASARAENLPEPRGPRGRDGSAQSSTETREHGDGEPDGTAPQPGLTHRKLRGQRKPQSRSSQAAKAGPKSPSGPKSRAPHNLSGTPPSPQGHPQHLEHRSFRKPPPSLSPPPQTHTERGQRGQGRSETLLPRSPPPHTHFPVTPRARR